MVPERRARGASISGSTRGRSSRGHRGRGARAPRATRCRRGRGGSSGSIFAAAMSEGSLCYDFVLRILSRIASQIFLPSSFVVVVSGLVLDGLWLQLQGCSRRPLWVKLQVENSLLVFLDT